MRRVAIAARLGLLCDRIPIDHLTRRPIQHNSLARYSPARSPVITSTLKPKRTARLTLIAPLGVCGDIAGGAEFSASRHAATDGYAFDWGEASFAITLEQPTNRNAAGVGTA